MTRLKKTRIDRGLKACVLAQRLNITRQCVCIAEKKGIRNVSAAKRYAAVLGCDWRDLLDDGGSDGSDRSDGSDNKTMEERHDG